jgi:hypothetical protein
MHIYIFLYRYTYSVENHLVIFFYLSADKVGLAELQAVVGGGDAAGAADVEAVVAVVEQEE